MPSGQVKNADNAAKRLARLAAVQALYQSNYEQQQIKQIINDCADNGFANLLDDEAPAPDGKPDLSLFSKIAAGACDKTDELDEIIAGVLDARISFTRLEVLLRSILRAGTYELLAHEDVPAGVIINDYIDITRAFFGGKEPALVNGILDKLASKLRG